MGFNQLNNLGEYQRWINVTHVDHQLLERKQKQKSSLLLLFIAFSVRHVEINVNRFVLSWNMNGSELRLLLKETLQAPVHIQGNSCKTQWIKPKNKNKNPHARSYKRATAVKLSGLCQKTKTHARSYMKEDPTKKHQQKTVGTAS